MVLIPHIQLLCQNMVRITHDATWPLPVQSEMQVAATEVCKGPFCLNNSVIWPAPHFSPLLDFAGCCQDGNGQNYHTELHNGSSEIYDITVTTSVFYTWHALENRWRSHLRKSENVFFIFNPLFKSFTYHSLPSYHLTLRRGFRYENNMWNLKALVIIFSVISLIQHSPGCQTFIPPPINKKDASLKKSMAWIQRRSLFVFPWDSVYHRVK